MAIPTISSLEALNSTSITATFSVPVAISDLTGLSITRDGETVSVKGSIVNSTEIEFGMPTANALHTLTISFAASNTITAVIGGESLAESLNEAVANKIPASIVAGAIQDSMAIHTAVKVLADEAKAACQAAC